MKQTDATVAGDEYFSKLNNFLYTHTHTHSNSPITHTHTGTHTGTHDLVDLGPYSTAKREAICLLYRWFRCLPALQSPPHGATKVHEIVIERMCDGYILTYIDFPSFHHIRGWCVCVYVCMCDQTTPGTAFQRCTDLEPKHTQGRSLNHALMTVKLPAFRFED